MARCMLARLTNLVLILSILLAACAPVDTPSASPSPEGETNPSFPESVPQQSTLSFFLLDRPQESQAEIVDTIEQIAAEADVAADIRFVSFESLLTSLQAGEISDLIELPNDQIALWLREGQLAELKDIDRELFSGAVVVDQTAFSVAWRFNCAGIGLAAGNTAHYDMALRILTLLAVPDPGPCPLENPGPEAWVPYGADLDRAMIGDATLVPADFVVRDSLREIAPILAEEGVSINIARSVILSDELGSTRLAPVLESADPGEVGDVIIGMTVIEGEESAAGVPPGVYVVRSVEPENPAVVLESPNRERYSAEALGLSENPFDLPTAAIFQGSRDCRCCLFGWCWSFRCG